MVVNNVKCSTMFENSNLKKCNVKLITRTHYGELKNLIIQTKFKNAMYGRLNFLSPKN